MRVRYTALLVPAALLCVTGRATAQREVTVGASTLQSLDARLQTFARGLAPAERAAWDAVLRQAAAAPADNPAGVPVKGTFYAGCGCITGTPGAIIVQGGRANTGPATRGTPSPFIIVQGGAPASRAAGVGGGPTRPGDPAAIGPKPDDPLVALNAKVHAFAATLSGDEQATFDWLLQRAATQGQRGPGGMPPAPTRAMGMQGPRGAPGGLPASTPSLGQALGLVALGPKQDDPAPPPPADLHVVLKF
ncbi:MAG TPA: hypothetical protein VFJ16_21330 [Longimicrobium sp.]|nr:hypothetical protein [Longimicrobium sp.]